MILDELVELRVREINDRYSESRIVKSENCSERNHAVVFIQEKKYSGQFDNAKFYVEMMPTCFVIADIYKKQVYQYSIGTASGSWQEKLSELKEAVGKVAKQGLDAIKDELEEENLGKFDSPMELN